eukprot:SAG11_NODE_15675_length_569_cov_75.604255_1_plen_99_part_00
MGGNLFLVLFSGPLGCRSSGAVFHVLSVKIQEVFSRGFKILIKCGSVFSRVCAYSFVTLFFLGFSVLHFYRVFTYYICSVDIVVLTGCFFVVSGRVFV